MTGAIDAAWLLGLRPESQLTKLGLTDSKALLPLPFKSWADWSLALAQSAASCRVSVPARTRAHARVGHA